MLEKWSSETCFTTLGVGDQHVMFTLDVTSLSFVSKSELLYICMEIKTLTVGEMQINFERTALFSLIPSRQIPCRYIDLCKASISPIAIEIRHPAHQTKAELLQYQ